MGITGIASHTGAPVLKSTVQPARHRFMRDWGLLMAEVLNDLSALDVDSSARGADVAWANLTSTWDLCFKQATEGKQSGPKP